MTTQFDHLRPTTAEYPAGVYRVVGTAEGSVTLLQVGDADGRRINTGELVTVERDSLDGFEPAENPDGNRTPAGWIRANLSRSYWAFRSYVSELLAHPIPSALAIAVLVAGDFTGRIGFIPDSLSLPLTIAGVVGVTYIGAGLMSKQAGQSSVE